MLETDKKKERAPQIENKIIPKKQHCLRGVNGNYIQWNQILRDILNGMLKIIQNRTQKFDSDSESKESEIHEESDFQMMNSNTSDKTGTSQH